MLMTFRSKAAGEIVMLAQHAQPILEIAGKLKEVSLEPQGVFTPEQLPAAIQRLEAAFVAEPEPETEEAPSNSHDDDEDEKPKQYDWVGLRQRAYPLLEMLKAANAAQVNVTWTTRS